MNKILKDFESFKVVLPEIKTGYEVIDLISEHYPQHIARFVPEQTGIHHIFVYNNGNVQYGGVSEDSLKWFKISKIKEKKFEEVFPVN
tara:strand:- start:5701 stop:5964 length:264 start_codon:yes stop_codon:yes gene_type:complete